MSDTVLDRLTVNGMTYVREGTSSKPGKRAVVVVDRGWIFVGDVEEHEGYIYLSRGKQVLSWSQNGFAGLCADPKSAGAKLLPMAQVVQIPKDSEIFRVPVEDTWGL